MVNKEDKKPERETTNAKLRVVEALQDDAYRGIARVDPTLMRKLRLQRGDIISIKGLCGWMSKAFLKVWRRISRRIFSPKNSPLIRSFPDSTFSLSMNFPAGLILTS